ncbi:VanW family protein [Roseateles sp.]|uniref:VanW family protein n=1 Tax=Roseateles sp. TaxID=1971397 RepID=UPI003262D2C1
MTAESWRLPRRRDALSFWLRTRLLSLRSLVMYALSPSAVRWPAAGALADAPVVAQHRSPLWTDGDDAEFSLTAGKVENLRLAIKAFQAVEIRAGGVLSFWAQLGRPSARRGFVVGREIREGCIVPTVAGGICQLSNALAAVAARAGIEFVERHAHSARTNATPEQGLDATLFWHHIDLKLRARAAWRLDVTMDDRELIVSLRSHAPPAARAVVMQPQRPARALARSCLDCQETQCFRHEQHRGLRSQSARTAALLDAWSPEFAGYLAARQAEHFAPVPLRLAFWRPRGRAWSEVAWAAKATSLRGALWRRLWARHGGGRRQAAILDAQRWLAQAYAAVLTPLHTRLIVDQALLPHLALCGALDGREVEVLAHSLPFDEIHARLDLAAQRHPAASLSDFRASPELVAAEAQGLARARRLVTPHADVASVLGRAFGEKVTRLPWATVSARPLATPDCGQPPLLLFPAPAVARKGAPELAVALAGLGCRLRVLGRLDAAAWPGITLDGAAAGDPLDGVVAVVLPAHVEHAPWLLLRALAQGLPVIATPACGLDAGSGLTLVDAGDTAALRVALITMLGAERRHA